LNEYSRLISLVSNHFAQIGVRYALAGGLAASLYRETIRTTDDIDFIISYGESDIKKLNILANKISRKVELVRKAELEGGPLFAIKRKSTEVVLIRLLDKDNPKLLPIDLLLVNNKWVPKALDRSLMLSNSTLEIPVISPEDLILAKLISLQNRTDRLQDAQDIREILLAQQNIDWSYLKLELVRHAVTIPEQFKGYFPQKFEKICKSIKRTLSVSSKL
jgi:hypothetical protein